LICHTITCFVTSPYSLSYVPSPSPSLSPPPPRPTLFPYTTLFRSMPGGHQRQANLHALYQRAHSYEQSSFKGLYQFIRFIEKMQEHDKDLGVAPTQLTANTVNVMTIHGSKGLQFPVVFLIDATHGFNKGAVRENTVVDAVAGVGIRYM